MPRRPSGGGFVVANPGSVPEVQAAASGVARAGSLSRYHVPLSTTPRTEQLVGALPPGLRQPLLRELRRRSAPEAIPLAAVRRTAASSELLRLAVVRAGFASSISTRLLRRQSRIFDSRVQRHLRPSDAGVLTVSAAARRTLTRARALGVPGFLACPLAHHRVTIELLREEAGRVPEFAATLPAPAILEAMSADLDMELELAQRVLTLSTFETRSYVDCGVDPARIVQIPPGVDGELFRPRVRQEDGIFRVLFVGQLTQRKGLSYLLEAFRLAAIPRSELVLVGAPYGTTKPWSRWQGVRHLPPLPQSELAAIYNGADVFVMPSIVEGSCLTALEAMASGLPVVVSENTGTPDVIEEGREGHVVPIRDAEAIAERLRELRADRDGRLRMGAAARRRAQELTWERYGQQVAQALGAAAR